MGFGDSPNTMKWVRLMNHMFKLEKKGCFDLQFAKNTVRYEQKIIFPIIPLVSFIFM